ncbi:HEAT repeat domain-containing protein [Leptospira langatensis]|uniref:HEAT repeat domain-containing protein n=2 Tax=Leptospira langatensis TaxID=2484983 RepID=A0A5F1ZVM0_9LEPT|nr:HEAT repeat domain-containing protein [Leptospira langatensis]TGK02861.1 HEAT repeat domain-containing protein [Leptospira langatensis]TGL41615.1 HEAT repeat domain-containing protein [Leptospira langatensis]
MHSRITSRLLSTALLLAFSVGPYLSPLFAQADAQPSSEQAPADPQADPSNENAPADPQPSPEKPKKQVVDKETKKYNEQFKRGLLKVFEAEANHRYSVLEKYGLTHPIPRVRAAAALALGRLGNKIGAKTIHKMIDRDGEYVRQAAYKGLADIGSRSSLEYFYAGAKSSDRDIRVYSFRGMGKTMDPGAREVLLKKGLTSDDKEIVKASILGLGYYQVPEDIRIFIDYLNSNDEELQKAAVEALGRHKTRTSMKILEDSFASKPNLRAQILDTLTEQKNSFAIFALLRILDANSNSESITKEISIRLFRLKAFGKYMTVISDKTPLMREPYVGAQKIRDLEIGEVGKVLGKSSAAYIIPIDGKRIEDFYFKVLVNTKYKDAFTETVQGWVFGKYLQIRTISAPASEKKKPKFKRPSILDDVEPSNPQATSSSDSDANPSTQEDPNSP